MGMQDHPQKCGECGISESQRLNEVYEHDNSALFSWKLRQLQVCNKDNMLMVPFLEIV